MTSAERFKEIEERLLTISGQRNSVRGVNLSLDEAHWLIARVKRLTEALEYYQEGWVERMMNDRGFIARTVLEDG